LRMFVIEEFILSGLGIKKEFAEAATLPLEEIVLDIVTALLLLGPALIRRREDLAAEERRRREVEQVRQI
jgi:hypothetical protein